MTSERIEDNPTGSPGEPAPEHGKDAPDLPPDQAGRSAGGNQVDDAGKGDDPHRDDPARHAHASDTGPTAADAVIPALATDWRVKKGSDPDDPLAGLLAAGASSPGVIDESAYREYLEAHPDQGWASVDDLAERYGSFSAALAAAGMSS